jgi:autotransporter-associated beta strand protein
VGDGASLGGTGGIGLYFAQAGSAVTIDAAITGGMGGGNVSSSSGASNSGGAALSASGRQFMITAGGSVTGGDSSTNALYKNGLGGVGIVGSDLAIITAGAISGGLGSNGVTRANAITFTGGTNTIRFLNGTSGLSGNIGVAGSLTFDQSGVDTVVANTITGTGAVIKTGSETITLSSANTYTGGTTIAGGALSISSDANLGASSGGLTFDGGTLQITGVFNLANTRAITLNSGGGTFDMGGSGITTFSQSFGGSGPVTFTNGLAALSAVNTYSGTTTITSSGTLAANTAGVLSPNSDFTVNGLLLLNGFDNTIKSLSGSGGVVNSAGATLAMTLTIAPPSGVTTFSGTLGDGFGGPLSLVKAGAGTQVLSGTNTYTGGTTISGGTLAVTDDSNLGATSGGLTFNGGTLQTSTLVGVPNFATSRAVTLLAAGGTIETLRLSFLDGNISGAGGLTKTGILPLVLGGTSTYIGPTNVNEGTLSPGSTGGFSASSAFTVAAGANIELRGIDASIGSLAGAGTVTNSNVAPAVLTTGSDNTSTTFSGTMSNTSGPLSLIKVGAGTQVFSGNNSYTGATTVNGGTLSVNGSIASSSLTTVNTGGTLGGNGTVGNTTVNGGTLSPGNSIGALTVQGNLTMTAASTYMVEVDPTHSDFTHVTGTAALGGATVAAQFAPGSYVEKRYTILTADGGVTGTFAGPVNTNLPTNFRSALATDPNNAYLDLKLNFRVPGGLNVNQNNVATALVNSFNANGGIPLAFGALDPRGLSLASGEIGTTASQAAFDAQSQFLNSLTGPFVAGGQGAVSMSPSSPPMAYAGARKPHDAFASLAAKAPPMQTFDQRWRIFGAAYGGNTQIGGNAALGSHDATSRVYGAMGGASYALSPATQLGFAFGGGGTSFGLSDGLGSGRSDLFQAGVFAHHGFARGGYLSGAFAYGWHDVTTDRTASTGERLRGAYKAGVLSGRLEAGWRIDTAWAGVTPYAAAQAISYRMPSYLEQGNGAADSFALGYAGRDVTATRSELGLRLDRTTVMGDTLLTLRGRAAWAHNFDTARNVAATFQSLPGSGFIVNGAAMAPDAALVSAGAEVAWRNGFALAASFEGEFSNNVTSYTGKGTLRYAW